MYISTNSQTWTSLNNGFDNETNGIAWNGSLWVAVGSDIYYSILTSPDAQTWTPSSSPYIPNTYVGQDVAWNGSMWVVVGSHTQGGSYTDIYTSLDGKIWTSSGGFGSANSGGFGIAWNGSLWVAVGQGNNTILTSPDAQIWTPPNSGGFTTNGNGIAWNGSLWVAVGRGTNTILTSPDAQIWTPPTSGGFTVCGNGIAWNGSLWVAVGQGNNTILTSPDAQTWTPPTYGGGFPSVAIDDGGYGVTWNGSLWIAVGVDNDKPSNSILTSSDGQQWTLATNNSLWDAHGVSSTNVWGQTGPTDLQSTIEKLKYAVFFQKGTVI